MAEEGSGTGLEEKPGIVEAEEEVSRAVVQELSGDTVVFGDSRLIWKIIDPPPKVVAISPEMALVVEEELTADREAGLALSVAEAMEVEIIDLTESLLVEKRVEFSPKMVNICPEVTGEIEEWMGFIRIMD